MKLPVVAIVGKPNVGKSTLFNKLARKRISISSDIPGVTRDRIYTICEYDDYKFHLIDTGGIDISKGDFNEEIKVQASIAIDEADVILFMVDGKEGLTNSDYTVRDMLIKTNKKVIVVINKIDSKESDKNIYDFYELGFEHYFPISSEHSKGIGELLNEIVSDFKIIDLAEDKDTVKFAVIGRPNVGKSSLINALLNEDRNIVSNIAGTTRDSVDTPFIYNKRNMIAIDTAGLKKRGRIYEAIEKFSYFRSLKSIERCDVCVLVISAEEGIIEHDKHVAGYALDSGRSLVIVVNKWDVIEEKDKEMKSYTKLIRNEFKFLSFVPIVFLSAKTKKRIHTLLPEVLRVYENMKKEIKTSLLNNVIIDAVTLNPPPSYKGRKLKVYFSHQSGICPPTFTLNVNDKKLVHFSYERYLENKIRESFDLTGTPIRIEFKNKNDSD